MEELQRIVVDTLEALPAPPCACERTDEVVSEAQVWDGLDETQEG